MGQIALLSWKSSKQAVAPLYHEGWLENRAHAGAFPDNSKVRVAHLLRRAGFGGDRATLDEYAALGIDGAIDRRTGEFVEQKNQHDAGPKTVLEHSGNLDGDDVIDIIVRHPAAGPFIAHKLFSFFVYPNPEPEVLQPISDMYYRSVFSIKETLRAVLSSDAFFSDKAYRARVKSPTEFIVGIVSALGLKTDFTGIPARLARMGQVLFNPPNAAGWPGGPAWINTSTWLERMNMLHALSTAPPQAIQGLPEVIGALNGRPGPASVDAMIDLLLDGDVSDETRQVLLNYAGSRLTPATARDLLYLVIGSPEYQLA